MAGRSNDHPINGKRRTVGSQAVGVVARSRKCTSGDRARSRATANEVSRKTALSKMIESAA